MARYDPIVPRPRDGGRRDSGDLPDSLQRVLYQQMLSEELGRNPEGFVPAPLRRSWREVLLPVMMMLVLAALILAAVWIFAQWRAGEISFTTPAKVVTEAERAWRREDRQRPAEELAPQMSEMEDALEAARRPVEAETETEAAAEE